MTRRTPGTVWERLYPELLLFEREEDRTAAWQSAPPLFKDRTWSYLLVVTGILWWPVAIWLSTVVSARVLALRNPWFAVAIGVFTLLLCLAQVVAFNWFISRPVRRSLRRSLVACGIPVCLHCGYDVRGPIEPCCPECGRGFDPKLRDLWQSQHRKQVEPSHN